MRRLRIRTRLVVGTSILAAAVLAVALIIARAEVARLLHDTAVDLAQSDLNSFATDLRTNPDESPDTVANGLLIVIRSSSGRDAVNTAPHDVQIALPREVGRDESFDVDDDEGRSYVVVGERVATRTGEWSLWAARDVTTTRSAITAIDAVFALVGLALLVVMVAGSMLLTRSALRPVDELRRHAEHLGDDDLLPVDPNGDELARLARTLNGLVQRVREGASRERRMVSDAAHELRTPLAGLRAELELTSRHPDDPAAVGAGLASARRSSERLEDLATNLLELSRLDEGADPHADLSAEAIVAEVLDAIDRARSRVAASAVEIGVQIGVTDSAATYRVGPYAVARIVDNLLSNALRAVGPEGTIGVEATDDAEGIRLRVDDDGTGAPDDFLPQAFERFARAEASRSEAGSGLGLALVAGIARSAGGSARVENLRPGFRAEVRLPKM